METKFKSVLLIDDKIGDNRYNEIILGQMNVIDRIEIAENGEDALKILEHANIAQPKLIFLDINMPRMNGWEFLDEYQALGLHIKTKNVIIVLTTSMNPEDKAKADQISFVSEFHIKPLTQEKIKNILDKYLVYNN
ncbi:response regulator [Ferruginibacter sp. SUN002]|uniref:response regulator n=1 Tax=Ferruginibacter sp. SUN002 TaxID=2937789 RepID=UPI003D36EEA3